MEDDNESKHDPCVPIGINKDIEIRNTNPDIKNVILNVKIKVSSLGIKMNHIRKHVIVIVNFIKM